MTYGSPIGRAFTGGAIACPFQKFGGEPEPEPTHEPHHTGTGTLPLVASSFGRDRQFRFESSPKQREGSRRIESKQR